MKFLNREAAPISAELWTMIDTVMMDLLAKRLKIRSVVDFDDSYGFETDAVSTGRLKTLSDAGGVTLSVREPILMTEIRHDFSVPKRALEEMKRDMAEVDDSALRRAANTFADAENGLILEGVRADGLLPLLSQPPLEAKGAAGLMVAVARCQGMFSDEFVVGSFKLLVSNATFSMLVTESEGGETMKKKIENILGVDSILVSDAVGDDKALVIAQRGGDFIFYSGLDVQVGFDSQSEEELNLFLIESCAFRVVAPEAAIRINLP